MSMNIRFPNITGITEKEQLAQIKGFLYQLVEQLNYALPLLDPEGGETQTPAAQTYRTQGGEMGYDELLALIVQEQQKLGGSVDALENHAQNKSNPHGVTAEQVGATPASHGEDKSNPHGVTAEQVGLGNVPNVATNDQTPTFTAASELAPPASGETVSVVFGKIAKAITDLIAHIQSRDNPHGVTAEQAGIDAGKYCALDLLWSNPSQVSGFPAQTITVDTSEYNYLAVEVAFNEKDLNGSQINFVGMRKPGQGETVVTLTADLITSSGSYNTARRKLTVSDERSAITAYEGQGNDGTTNNNRAIPLKIYGMKGV